MTYVKFHVKTAEGSRNLREHLATDQIALAGIGFNVGTASEIVIDDTTIVTRDNSCTLTNKVIGPNQLTVPAMEQVLQQHNSAVWKQANSFAAEGASDSFASQISFPVATSTQATKGTLLTAAGYVVQVRNSLTGNPVPDGDVDVNGLGEGAVHALLTNSVTEFGPATITGNQVAATDIGAAFAVGDMVTAVLSIGAPPTNIGIVLSKTTDALTLVEASSASGSQTVSSSKWTLTYKTHLNNAYSFATSTNIDVLFAEVYDYNDRPFTADLYGAGFVDPITMPEHHHHVFADITDSIANSQFNAYSNLVFSGNIASTYMPDIIEVKEEYTIDFTGALPTSGSLTISNAAFVDPAFVDIVVPWNVAYLDWTAFAAAVEIAIGGTTGLLFDFARVDSTITLTRMASGDFTDPAVSYTFDDGMAVLGINAEYSPGVIYPKVSHVNHVHNYTELLGTVPDADFDAYNNLSVSNRLYTTFTAPAADVAAVKEIIFAGTWIAGDTVRCYINNATYAEYTMIEGDIISSITEGMRDALNALVGSPVISVGGGPGRVPVVYTTVGPQLEFHTWNDSLLGTSVASTTTEGSIAAIAGVSTADHTHQYSEILNHIEAYDDLLAHTRIYSDTLANGAAVNEIVQIFFGGEAAGGTFDFSFAEGDTTFITPLSLEDAQFRLNETYGRNNIIVSEVNPTTYRFTCNRDLAGQYFALPVINNNSVVDGDSNLIVITPSIVTPGRPLVQDGVASNHHTHVIADITNLANLDVYQELINEGRVTPVGDTAAVGEVQQIVIAADALPTAGSLTVKFSGLASIVVTPDVGTWQELLDTATSQIVDQLYAMYDPNPPPMTLTASSAGGANVITVTYGSDQGNMGRIYCTTTLDQNAVVSVNQVVEGAVAILDGVANRQHVHMTLAPRRYTAGAVMTAGQVGYVGPDGLVRVASCTDTTVAINIKRLVVCVANTVFAPREVDFYIAANTIVTMPTNAFAGMTIGQELYLGVDGAVTDVLPEASVDPVQRIIIGYVFSHYQWEFMQSQYFETSVG